MMRYFSLCFAVLCLLFVSGCSNVVSKYPIGEVLYTPSAATLDGTWYSNGEFIKIKVIDDKMGLVKLAWLEEQEKNFTLETITCTLMKSGETLYVNVLDESEKSLKGYYYWGKLKIEDDKILFWLPSFDAFEQAVAAKKVTASVEKTAPDKAGKKRVTDIKLINDPKVILDLIQDEQWKYFEYEDPIILIKLVD